MRQHRHRRPAATCRRVAVRCLVGLTTAFAPVPVKTETSERARFLDRFMCEITARLEEIHRRGPVTTSRDRFLTVALYGRPQHYVQCIFHDRDTAMFCEASSGAYRYAADAGARLRQSPESIAALHALGFVQADPRKNFSREVALGDPPDVRIAARLMLATLHDAYGAGPATGLAGIGPPGWPPHERCGAPRR